MAILQDLQAQIEALKAENAALKRAKPSQGLKISEKGALSVYGLGRFPVTLYKGQWLSLLDKAQDIKDFIAAHDSELKGKGDEH